MQYFLKFSCSTFYHFQIAIITFYWIHGTIRVHNLNTIFDALTTISVEECFNSLVQLLNSNADLPLKIYGLTVSISQNKRQQLDTWSKHWRMMGHARRVRQTVGKKRWHNHPGLHSLFVTTSRPIPFGGSCEQAFSKLLPVFSSVSLYRTNNTSIKHTWFWNWHVHVQSDRATVWHLFPNLPDCPQTIEPSQRNTWYDGSPFLCHQI